jgi:putative membrane protein
MTPEKTTLNIKRAFVFMAAVACAIAFQPAAYAQAPTDPQIVGIVVSANQIDIDYAKLALSKSKDQNTRDFAQQMVTDHSALQKAVFDLGAKLKVTPADSDTSKSLKAQAAETTNKLNALKGKAFDKAYVQNEIAFHKAVMDANSTVLIPNAQNAELKGALTNAQPLFQGHLEHAQKVQSAEGRTSAKSHDHASATKANKVTTVVIRDLAYQPQTLRVNAGEVIEWKNADAIPHTATAVDGRSFDSGSIAKGTPWHYVAKHKGTYEYVCTFHPNMKATLIVQ